jgi:uncharacterized damage-inducible protein DinB
MMYDTAGEVRKALIQEVEQLRDEVHQIVEPLTQGQLWMKPVEPGNSIGHLILHLAGNLKHFVGAQLGGTGYVRDRDREFTEAQRPAKSGLLANLDEALETFRKVVGNLHAEQLAETHPHAPFGSVLKALVHLVAHFALHRGQMTYIARLVSPTK